MENCMTYYNQYLSNALRRRQQGKQNYKDLYLTELLRFKKEISFPHSIKWKSMFDFILDSYQLTREKKLDTYTYFLSGNNDGAAGFSYIPKNRDAIISGFSLVGISVFKIDYNGDNIDRDFIKDITSLFLSNPNVLGSSKVTLDEDSEEIYIHGKTETSYIL